LSVEQEPHRDSLLEERVLNLLALAFLVGGEDGLAGVFVHEDGAGFLALEAIGADLLAIDESEGEPVGQDGSKLFHEVEGEPGSAWSVTMEKADGGVEADGFQGAGGIVAQQDVEERKKGVHGVEGRATAAGWETKVFFLGQDEVIENGEIEFGTGAFHAAELLQVERLLGFRGQATQQAAQVVGGLLERGCVLAGAFAGRAQEHGPAVGQLGGHDGGRDAGGRRFVVAAAVLLAAEQDVARYGAVDPGQEPAAKAQKRDCDVANGAGVQERGTAGDLLEADEPVEVVEGQAKAGFLVHANDKGLAFQGEIGALGRDVERVEQSFHSFTFQMGREGRRPERPHRSAAARSMRRRKAPALRSPLVTSGRQRWTNEQARHLAGS